MIQVLGLSERGADFSYDPRAHPGLSMVRTVMYIFILFVVFWNVNATSHVFSVQPDFENEVNIRFKENLRRKMASHYFLVV